MNMELKIPPPVVALICALIMWVLSRILPSLSFDLYNRKAIATFMLVVGLAIDILAFVKFKQSHTTINPMKPGKTTDLVINGVYTISRNPMYLGLFIILSAWAVFVSNFIAIIVLPVFVLYITKFQIVPEEAFMQKKFGTSFTRYRQAVRRWI